MGIVPALEEFEGSDAGLGRGAELTSIDELAFKGREEALAEGVIETVSHRSHRRAYSHGSAALAEGDGVPIVPGCSELADPEALLKLAPWIVVTMPIAEEVFFRGYLYRFVAQRAGMEHTEPFIFNGIRFALGGAWLIPLLLANRRRQTARVKRR